MPPSQPFGPFSATGVQIYLQNVQLRDDIILDEVHLEGGGVEVTLPDSAGELRLQAGETGIRALITELNLAKLITANTPADAPVRNLSVALLSGRARVSGQFTRSVLSLPFTAEVMPRIENGVRVTWEIGKGLPVPAAVVEIIEQQINSRATIDLSHLPIPVRLDEIRLEPGRLTVVGKARLSWPLAPEISLMAPFSASTLPTS